MKLLTKAHAVKLDGSQLTVCFNMADMVCTCQVISQSITAPAVAFQDERLSLSAAVLQQLVVVSATTGAVTGDVQGQCQSIMLYRLRRLVGTAEVHKPW